MYQFINSNLTSRSLDIYDAREAPFTLHGLYQPETPGLFRRMPAEVAANVSNNVRRLSTNTSGARLRFKTNSKVISIGAVYPPIEYVTADSAAISPIGGCSFSLYADGKFCKILSPFLNNLVQEGNLPHFVFPSVTYDNAPEGSHLFESMYEFTDHKLREITICFPYFMNISDLFVGVEKGSIVEEATPYPNEKPVVFYGSSITQGACASHPGNMYQNILSRKLNFDFLNLGFSGSAKAEDTIIDYLGSLDMSVLVFDYDHNSTPESLLATHYKSLAKLRTALPEVPIILLSRPNQCGGIEQVKERLAIIEGNYQKFLEQGEKNMYFINGQDIFYRLDSDAATIDGTHPTDLGFYCMAEAIADVLKKCL